MDNILKSDLYRYAGQTNTRSFIKSWYKPGFRYLYFLRTENLTKYKIFKLICRCFLRRYSIKYGIQIPRGTKIGKGFYIGHFGNIIINNLSVIGENCNIAQGVTIGRTNRGEKKGTPILGNQVWIGVNAVIVGNVNIGNNVLIAPLTFVNVNVPDNSIVVGNPCVIKPKLNATEGYINNVLK